MNPLLPQNPPFRVFLSEGMVGYYAKSEAFVVSSGGETVQTKGVDSSDGWCKNRQLFFFTTAWLFTIKADISMHKFL